VIGTASPGSALTVSGDIEIVGGNRTLKNSSGFLQVGTTSNDYLAFLTNNGEKARIDTSGRLLVGTSSARSNFFNTSTVTAGIQAEATGEGSIVAAIRNVNDATTVPVYLLAKSRGTTVGSNTVVQSGDHLGYLSFQGSDGSEFVEAARISGEVDGTPGANDMPGRLVFSTTADNASSPTEQLRITSDRYVRLASGTGGIQFNGDTAAANALDDYEEGTWTPALSATGATFVYAQQSGRYTKIGNTVVVHARIILSSTSGGSGNVEVTGLPFTTAASVAGNNVGQQGIIGRAENFAGDVPMSIEPPGSTTVALLFYRTASNGGTTQLAYADLGNSADFLFTLTYQAA